MVKTEIDIPNILPDIGWIRSGGGRHFIVRIYGSREIV